MSATIIPCIHYKDASVMSSWLCDVFVFNVHAAYYGDHDILMHAELVLGESMIMLGSVKTDSEYWRYMCLPSYTNGQNTQSPYLIISEDEIDAHYEKAVRGGARILIPLREQDYGGKLYTCADPEGHVWNFGSYNPWEEK